MNSSYKHVRRLGNHSRPLCQHVWRDVCNLVLGIWGDAKEGKGGAGDERWGGRVKKVLLDKLFQGNTGFIWTWRRGVCGICWILCFQAALWGGTYVTAIILLGLLRTLSSSERFLLKRLVELLLWTWVLEGSISAVLQMRIVLVLQRLWLPVQTAVSGGESSS